METQTQTQTQELTHNLWDLLMSADETNFKLGKTILNTADWINDGEKEIMESFFTYRCETINYGNGHYGEECFMLNNCSTIEYIIDKGILRRLIQCSINCGYNTFYILDCYSIEFEDVYSILKIISSYNIDGIFHFEIGSHLKKLERYKSEIISMFEDTEWDLIINMPDVELNIGGSEWNLMDHSDELCDDLTKLIENDDYDDDCE